MAEQATESSPNQAPATPQPESPGRGVSPVSVAVKVIITLVGLAALAIYGNYTVEAMRVRHEYNTIVNIMEHGHYAAAVTGFEALLPRAEVDDETLANVERDLAFCYVALARSSTVGSDEQARYYKDAYALYPDALDNEEQAMVSK